MSKELENELDRSTHEYKKSTIINIGSDRPNAPKERHFVNNAAFYEALVKRRAEVEANEVAGLPKPQISDFIGECILSIATRLATKHQFSGYSYKNEMINDAVEHCCRYIDSFDTDKTKNPFSYYTQACYYAFLGRIKSEQKDLYVKCKSTIDAVTNAELSTIGDHSSAEVKSIHDNLDIDMSFAEEYVADYERKLEEQRNRYRKPVVRGLDLLDVSEEEEE